MLPRSGSDDRLTVTIDMSDNFVQKVAAQTARNGNFPRTLNERFRPVPQHSRVRCPRALRRQFSSPVYLMPLTASPSSAQPFTLCSVTRRIWGG
jgi:hypothetical protein